MDRRVWKYKLNMGATALTLPEGARVLFVGEQHGDPHIWVEQSSADNVPGNNYSFYVVGTGHVLPEGNVYCEYVGSYISDPFVWHIYQTW